MKILYATDGSEAAKTAARTLAALPLRDTDRISVLTVAERESDDDLLDDMRDDARAVAEAARDSLDVPCPVEIEVRDGEASRQIVEAAIEGGADLIVIGSHGHSGLQRFLLGSMARNVLHAARCSVLVAREANATDAPLRVLIGYDGSAPASRAVAQVESLRFADRAVARVVSVMRIVTFYRQDILQRLSPGWQRRRQQRADQLQRAVDSLTPHIGAVESELVEAGSVSETLLEQAGQWSADLIVVGHASQRDMEDVLLGSVAERLANHATCSVWIAR